MSEISEEKSMYEVIEEKDLPANERFLEKAKQIPGKVFNIIQTVVIVFAFFIFLYLIFITPHQVDGLSMFPTYKNDEFLIANKAIYHLQKPKSGDVIIFKYDKNRDFIKRIIAVEGDTLSLQNGKYYLNGSLLDESEYLEPTIYTKDGPALHEGETITIPEGQYFVSGDNRDHSSDSRVFGPIKFTQIKGRVWFVFYPLTNFRVIQRPTY